MSILQFLTTVHFGFGASQRLPALLEQVGSKKPLIVSDHGVAKAGVLDQALSALNSASDHPRFLDTPANPTEAAARAGADFYVRQGCDAVIGVGGGAALDLAKAIAILATTDAPLWEFCNRHSASRPIKNPAPLLLMPTTSGSGSEVGRSAVIVFDNGIKAGVGASGLVSAAICDPDLTLRLPASVTAVTAMDALSHCIETYSSPVANPPCDAIALDGLKRGLAHVENAVANGATDKAARWHMMMTSLQGAVCFQKGMGAVHALSHPIGALGHHHGTLNAIFMPSVLRYNRQALGDKYQALTAALPDGATGDLADHLDNLNDRLGIPRRLSQLGLTVEQLDAIPEKALLDNAHKTNPRQIDASGYRELIATVF
ncbi:iron-containing alcohol dehydrogenase [Aureimonas fodinaquatilis]|uniref:Iron-containing alcohol dehydrogenase n=1 Tax=Aureimonas fodinaquatilis TaxID=2565783 RepID=A0A5B0DP96_9HYPH|nr:iron-containing alcohol dehydrogenase [Aureimonas fodinaquatilis]